MEDLTWPGKLIIGLALLAFSIAIFSRAFDLRSSLPMGSHFLWHISGALATVFMFYFAWSEEKIRLKSNHVQSSMDKVESPLKRGV